MSHPSPSRVLHATPGSSLAFPPLVAAEFAGVELEVADPFDPSIATSSSPIGRDPVLLVGGRRPDEDAAAGGDGAGGTSSSTAAAIFGGVAIAKYVSLLRADVGLTGYGVSESAEVDSWCDFASNALEAGPCGSLVRSAVGLVPRGASSIEMAKSDLRDALGVLDFRLRGREYLVGERMTLADITVASALVYPFKLICDADFRDPYPNVVRWFRACVERGEFRAVVGEVKLCKRELGAPGQQGGVLDGHQ